VRTVLMVNGPLPPEGKEFCPVCVSLYKNQAETAFRNEIQAGINERSDLPVIIDLKKFDFPEPQFAEVVAMSIMPQLGLLRVCWGHVLSAQLSALPPAMQGQMPGVPQLGRG
jgi:hypothetical protein